MEKKVKKIIWLVLVIFLLAIIFLPSYSKLQQLTARNNSLKQEIELLTKKIEELEGEKELLQDDEGYIEKIARRKLGLAKEGELIYKFNEE